MEIRSSGKASELREKGVMALRIPRIAGARMNKGTKINDRAAVASYLIYTTNSLYSTTSKRISTLSQTSSSFLYTSASSVLCLLGSCWSPP